MDLELFLLLLLFSPAEVSWTINLCNKFLPPKGTSTTDEPSTQKASQQTNQPANQWQFHYQGNVQNSKHATTFKSWQNIQTKISWFVVHDHWGEVGICRNVTLYFSREEEE